MEDKRIERLFEYTKWHIGVYLSIAGGLTAIISAASPNPSRVVLANPSGRPPSLSTSSFFNFYVNRWYGWWNFQKGKYLNKNKGSLRSPLLKAN